MYDLGDVVRLTYDHKDPGGALADAGSMAVTVTQPDGVTVTVTPVASYEQGRYRYDFTAAQAGWHTVRWAGTGTNPGASPPDGFHVRSVTPTLIVGLAEVKAHINKTGTDGDDELREMIDAATPVVEDVVGPVVVRSFVDVDQQGGLFLVLNPPVISLTSVTAVYTGGTSYTVADLDLDGETGIVRRLDGGRFAGPLRTVYVAGRRIVPGNILEGTKIIIAHAWETQRGHSGARPGFGEEDLVPTPSGYLVPRRAMEWLRPHQRGPMAA